MTQTIGITQSNDMYLTSTGNIAILSGIEAVGDAGRNVSQAQLGEEVLTITQGLPTFQTIFNGTPKVAIYEAYLRRALESIDGVVTVTQLNYTIRNGVFAYQATIETIYGTTFISG